MTTTILIWKQTQYHWLKAWTPTLATFLAWRLLRHHSANGYVHQHSFNNLDFKNFKWSWHDYGSAKQGLGGIEEDDKVTKKMVMCFHFVKGWRF